MPIDVQSPNLREFAETYHHPDLRGECSGVVHHALCLGSAGSGGSASSAPVPKNPVLEDLYRSFAIGRLKKAKNVLDNWLLSFKSYEHRWKRLYYRVCSSTTDSTTVFSSSEPQNLKSNLREFGSIESNLEASGSIEHADKLNKMKRSISRIWSLMNWLWSIKHKLLS